MEQSEIILTTYPLPLARKYAASINAAENLQGAQACIELLEATLQYAVFSMAQRCREHEDGLSTPTRKVLAEVLPRPSIGLWVKACDALDAECAPLSEESLCAGLRTAREDLAAFEALRESLDGKRGGRRASLLDAFSRFSELRNAVAHQRMTSAEFAGRYVLLRAAVEEILLAMPGLARWTLVYTRQVSVVRRAIDVKFNYLRGEGTPALRGEKLPLPVGPMLVQNATYLRSPDSPPRYVEMSAFVWSNGVDVHFLSGLDGRRGPRYVCTYNTISGQDLDEAKSELERCAPYLFEREEAAVTTATAVAAPESGDRLADMVEAFACDGSITSEEQAFLVAAAVRFGVASPEEAAAAVARVIACVAPGARIETRTAAVEAAVDGVVEREAPEEVEGPGAGEAASDVGLASEGAEVPTVPATASEVAVPAWLTDCALLASLSPEEVGLLAALPQHGAGVSNITVQRALGWAESDYWRVHGGLYKRGLIDVGRGRGGVLRRTPSLEEQLLAKVPEDGSHVGNTMLQRLLGWSDKRYWDTREALVARGVLGIGRGRGGSVRRTVVRRAALLQESS